MNKVTADGNTGRKNLSVTPGIYRFASLLKWWFRKSKVFYQVYTKYPPGYVEFNKMPLKSLILIIKVKEQKPPYNIWRYREIVI